MSDRGRLDDGSLGCFGRRPYASDKATDGRRTKPGASSLRVFNEIERERERERPLDFKDRTAERERKRPTVTRGRARAAVDQHQLESSQHAASSNSNDPAKAKQAQQSSNNGPLHIDPVRSRQHTHHPNAPPSQPSTTSASSHTHQRTYTHALYQLPITRRSQSASSASPSKHPDPYHPPPCSFEITSPLIVRRRAIERESNEGFFFSLSDRKEQGGKANKSREDLAVRNFRAGDLW